MYKVIFGIRVIEVIIVLLILRDTINVFYHSRSMRTTAIYLIAISIVLGGWFAVFNILFT